MDYKEISGGSILLPMLPIGFQSRELASVGSLPISALLIGPCIDNFIKKKGRNRSSCYMVTARVLIRKYARRHEK